MSLPEGQIVSTGVSANRQPPELPRAAERPPALVKVALKPPQTAASSATAANPTEQYPADMAFHAMLARLTGGISPIALTLAYFDWASHLLSAPQRQLEIAQNAVRDVARWADAARNVSPSGYQPWSLVEP